MDLTEIRNIISLIQFNADGIPIEYSKDGNKWYTFREYILDLENFKYRLKDNRIEKISSYLIKKNIEKDVIKIDIVSDKSFILQLQNKNIY